MGKKRRIKLRRNVTKKLLKRRMKTEHVMIVLAVDTLKSVS